jgi:deazaflavin-dependent oxidoreductase (nitroreductase family)
MRRVIGVLLLVAGVAGAAVAAFIVGMRSKFPPVVGTVRRVNRRVTNPAMLKSAGQPGAYAAVLHHTGRSSGRSYQTPIVPFPDGDTYLVALPYGPGVDWLRNVQASGRATLVTEGVTVEVTDPEVVPLAAVVDRLPESELRGLRFMNVTECLRLRRALPGSGEAAAATSSEAPV